MLSMRTVKRGARRALLGLHEAALPLGLFVLPRHYYVSLPDIRELRRTRDVWARRSAMGGIALDLGTQVAALRETCLPYRNEYADGALQRDLSGHDVGPGIGRIDSQALYAVVRARKPNRIVEVGGGASTFTMRAALNRNCADDPRRGGTITCIEPHPRRRLRETPPGALITKPVQRANPELFDGLAAGDLLFIDGTHTVRTGSDSVHLVLEVLPRLRPGVLVHFHDVFWPYGYRRDAGHTLFDWQESALVQAYMAHNRKDRVLFSLSLLHYDRPEAVRECFPLYERQPDDGHGLRASEGGDYPCSLYLEIG